MKKNREIGKYRIVTAILILTSIINLIPTIGMASVECLELLYGQVMTSDRNLSILMKHRSLLFGIIGGFILSSVFLAHLRTAAFAMGLTSMMGFILIAMKTGNYSTHIGKIVLIDMATGVVMLIGLIVHVSQQTHWR